MLPPIEAEPAQIGFYGVDIFLLLLDRIGVVEPQMTAPAEHTGDAEIEADRFGVADMEIAVGFRREAGHHRFGAAAVEVGLDDVADEIAHRFGGFATCTTCAIELRHVSSNPV